VWLDSTANRLDLKFARCGMVCLFTKIGQKFFQTSATCRNACNAAFYIVAMLFSVSSQWLTKATRYSVCFVVFLLSIWLDSCKTWDYGYGLGLGSSALPSDHAPSKSWLAPDVVSVNRPFTWPAHFSDASVVHAITGTELLRLVLHRKVASAILKTAKIAISQQRFDRCSRNFAV